jgi:glycosyltransferase involved in cell wall biosynthesis
VNRIAISSHVALIKGKEYDGIGNVMIKTLSSLTDEFIFVRHSMDGLLPSEVRIHQGSNIKSTVDLRVVSHIAPLRYITEVIKTCYYFSRKARVDVYIGIDPLNAVAGIFLKKIGRVDTAIFYTADYSPQRFNNSIMNKVYHWIDSYCVKNADEVWSVSTKIIKLRKDMGLDESKNIFLPNVPPIEYNKFRKNIHNRYNLITYGIIDKQLDFKGAIKAVSMLKDEMPELSFTIVGNGPEEDDVKGYAKSLGVEDKVHFMGRMPLSRTLELASMSGIGLALYTGEWGFNQFGDSTKCREYFNYGLPVISTDTHATVGEIREYQAGVVVDMNAVEYVKAIRQIMNNYATYSAHSSGLGRVYEGAHSRALQRLLSSK